MSVIRIAARFLEGKTFLPLGKGVGIAAAIALVGMMMVVVIEAFGRQFSLPILGTYEIVSYLLVFTFVFGLCYTGAKKYHLAIGILTSRFQPRARLLLLTVNYLISALACAIISWRTFIYTQIQIELGTTGVLLKSVPIYPFVFVVALGMAIQAWFFLVQFIYYLGEATGREQ